MNKNEKILLLQLILEDIRGNWGFDLEERYEMALDLAKELELQNFINSIKDYIERCKKGWNDGRYFRKSFERGGYERMEILHGLEKTISDKSEEFERSISILTSPEFRFDDWDKYQG